MLSSFVGPKASIKLQPYQSVVYLHPPQEHESLDPNALQDQTLWGNVTLSLPKAREIKSLVVKLVAHYTVAIPGYACVHARVPPIYLRLTGCFYTGQSPACLPNTRTSSRRRDTWEKASIRARFQTTIATRALIDVRCSFTWSLRIPRVSAPYERCSFGRVYHRLHAIAEGPSGTLKEEIPVEVIVNPAACASQ